MSLLVTLYISRKPHKYAIFIFQNDENENVQIYVKTLVAARALHKARA